MPKHISKTLAITLYDEEVAAWNALAAHVSERRSKAPEKYGYQRVTHSLIVRDVLQLVCESLAKEIGPEFAKSLAMPPKLSDFQVRRAERQAAARQLPQSVPKTRGRKPAVKPAEKPRRRTVWNRPRKGQAGDME